MKETGCIKHIFNVQTEDEKFMTFFEYTNKAQAIWQDLTPF